MAGAGRQVREVEMREVEGRDLALSSLGKLFWPQFGFTKRDLLDYYAAIAPVLLPHLRHRPLTLGRFPEGIDGPGFAQTECRGRPEWMATAAIRLRDGRLRNYCVVNDLASLLWVINLGTIELHPLLACSPRLEEPRAVLFDLDPVAPAGLAECAPVALVLRDELAEVGLRAVAKTSGAAGIHVVVPLDSPASYEQTRSFARGVSERLAARQPGIVARASRRVERAGTVLLDWAQNSERRSIVAPYSLRATRRPSVSTPVAWSELEAAAARERGAEDLVFGPAEVIERVTRVGDLFADALATGQRLPAGAPG